MTRAAVLLGGIVMVVAATQSACSETETPVYQVVAEREGYEIREYARNVVAEVQMPGQYRSALFGGFRQLADYISGANDQEQSIAMTAPVLHSERDGEAGERLHVVSFVMPEAYDLESLPTPDNQEIDLRVLPPRRYAALRFSGWAREGTVERKRAELLDLTARDELQLTGPYILAQYDPPWRLPFLRRNEVLVELSDPE
jgi:hypothetical protein